ncbi:P-loop containing nucleoside triphosphate hydrolase protein [Chytriomyces sp. MP71]|nr:P-loop containing nucleoside triphosphate hydrolase protein [Chytriomyces sp. MP71]
MATEEWLPNEVVGGSEKTQAADTRATEKRETLSPEETAGWYQFIAVFWLTAFVKKAARNPLQYDDIFKLHPRFAAKTSTERVQDAVDRHYKEAIAQIGKGGKVEKTKGNLTPKENALKWSLLKGILSAEKSKIILAVSLHLMHLIAQMLAPIILSVLLNAAPQSSVAYGMVAALFITQMTQALGWNNSQYVARGGKGILKSIVWLYSSMSVKAALVSMVYNKAFRLGTKGRAKYPTGVIMNLIASDCAVIEMSLQFLTDVFCLPLEVITLSIVIIVFAGPAGVSGLSFMILCTGLSLGISSLALGIERKALAATDERVKLTSEVINGIKIVKFFAWETPFFERLTMLREQELAQHIRLRMINASFSAIMNVIPAFTNVIVFTVYQALGNHVDAATVFSTLSVINLIKLPIAVAPFISQSVFSSLVSMERLAKFLAAEEMDESEVARRAAAVEKMDGSNAIEFQNASFEWSAAEGVEGDDEAEELTPKIADMPQSVSAETLTPPSIQSEKFSFKLQNINLNVKKGSLTLVVGRVGSGKSSLLSSLIGDMIPVEGVVAVNGRMGYSPQASWLQNTTLRANVLFGSPFDEKRYNETIQCCGLSKDLTLLPHGDMSDIGEKGITLSGGQAARVNLARAVYSNSDILLLDDPLAAVDSHVGKHILEECILGVCASKTVLLVSHQLHIAPQASHIVVMDNGVIAEQGSFAELMAAKSGFFSLMQEYGHEQVDEDEEANKKTVKKEKKVDQVADLKEDAKKGDDLTEEEERLVGSVAAKYYLFYFSNTGSMSFILLLLVLFCLWQAVRLLADLWLTFWVDNHFSQSNGWYMISLLIISMVQGALIGVVTVSFAFACIRAGRNIHKRALDSLLHVPMTFFETNPSGRIISRFSKDFSETDRQLPRLFQAVMETIMNVLGTFILMIYASPYMVVAIMCVIPLYGYILKLYRSCMRELKRLEAIARSPLYAQIGESFAGISAIRAFGATSVFIETQEKLQDLANRPTYILNCLDVWVATRAESFVAFLIAMMGLFGVALKIDTALLGLALSYALSMMFQLNFGLRNVAEVEARMNSVERLSHYITDLKPEGKTIAAAAPKQWPTKGTVDFKNLSIKYRPELQPVLHNLTFTIPAGTKLGVVGRTGAGKSSIIAALFRLVEFMEGGTVEIDGVDVSGLELNDLRSSLSIIPQAPILFDGTIRSNLDPFSKHTDEELWAVLERCSLRDYVSSIALKLDAVVSEGGSNLSVGQRQLLCLGRAMLIKSKILLIDEATASVDLETDSYIQKVLREDFAECTIMCIAHRLNTLMDYDKILVLDAGQLAEYDTPDNLASNPTSLFSSLLDETGPANAALLRRIAATKAAST